MKTIRVEVLRTRYIESRVPVMLTVPDNFEETESNEVRLLDAILGAIGDETFDDRPKIEETYRARFIKPVKRPGKYDVDLRGVKMGIRTIRRKA